MTTQKEKKPLPLKIIKEQFFEAASERQEIMAKELGQIEAELHEILSFAEPMQLNTDLKAKIVDLAKLVGHNPKATKRKEVTGSNISTLKKCEFIRHELKNGPSTKKSLLDKAAEKYERTVAPTFLDDAIRLCMEKKEIEEDGKQGRSPVFKAVTTTRKKG